MPLLEGRDVGARCEPFCGEASDNYPAGCNCSNSDFPHNWIKCDKSTQFFFVEKRMNAFADQCFCETKKKKGR